MKKGTPRHPKANRLARLLGIKLYAAVGILEMLWHYTAEYYPAGDVGRTSDEDIADALAWEQSSPGLIDALCNSGWIDRAPLPLRLVIHDWPHHAEDGVHLKLARAQRYFADGSTPKYGRLAGAEKVRADSFFLGEEMDVRSTSTSCASEAPRLGQGMAVLDTSSKESISKTEEPKENWFDQEFWPIYWRKVDKVEARKSFKKHATSESLKNQIVAAVRAHAPVYLRRDPEHRPHASTWLNKKRYEEEPEDFSTPQTPQKSKLEKLIDSI